MNTGFGVSLSVGHPSPWGMLPRTGASFVLDGFPTAFLVHQVPRDESPTEREILERGSLEVGLLTCGASALFIWRWMLDGDVEKVLAVDTPFHMGFEPMGRRILPLTPEGTVPIIVVTQDSDGTLRHFRGGDLGGPVSTALKNVAHRQVVDAGRRGFEERHQRSMRHWHQSTKSPLDAFERSIIRGSVLHAYAPILGDQH